MPEVTLLCLWPDGVTCELDELRYFTHKSDDYEIIYLTEDQYAEYLSTGDLP